MLVRDSSDPASARLPALLAVRQGGDDGGWRVRLGRPARLPVRACARRSDESSARLARRADAAGRRRRSSSGQVIAVGIFLTPGDDGRTLASPAWMLAVWLAIGAMALCGALCYGELAARCPGAGGGYVYLREAYGPRARLPLRMEEPAGDGSRASPPRSPSGSRSTSAYLRSALVLQAQGGRHGRDPRLRRGARAGRARWARACCAASTVVKLALLGVPHRGLRVRLRPRAAGATSCRSRTRPAGAPPLVAGAGRARWSSAFFSFGGWWDVTKLAGEVRDPARTLPRALWLGLTAVTIVYVGDQRRLHLPRADRQRAGSARPSPPRSARPLLRAAGGARRRGDRGRLRARQPRPRS